VETLLHSLLTRYIFVANT